MSAEFMDFLKHNYAYVAIGEFKPGKFAEAERLFANAVSTYTHGFKGAYLLREEPNTDKGIALILWDNIEDMDSNRNETHEKILKDMAHLFVSPPTTSFYQVSSEISGKT
ncbi:antibiotic biosynthesis monooxygenase [Spirulina sp. 06S082]|uniref:antibiotic biosynthesis monooxygenase family protein n=1 Tax=Spirulina sp. 06S082 TaxID=3110248 RepID=UPI002B1FF389|nr:antibiotic biosynthesis monooxygenase [Spirulina sp. 06S082]MEA5468120.1 antibiotic biosynthesis monooxygenase [Spirulina sp. 06S082]